VFRCLPMGAGYHAQVPIFTSFGKNGDSASALKCKGKKKKTVVVPAGKFNCFKVLLPMPVNQNFWFSDDEHRYPVKIDANGVVMPLVKVERLKAGEVRKYAGR